MIARFAKTVRRLIAAARRTPKPLRYAALSGQHADDVASGRLILVRHLLAGLGAADLPDGQQAWAGRHIKKAYRAATGTDPLMVWVQHRTTGRWIRVACYEPGHPALYAGLAGYKATRHLVAAPALLEVA